MRALQKDSHRPTIVVLQAGDIDIGAYDPFAELIPIAHESGACVHIDGAFGLWAAASPKHRYLLAGADWSRMRRFGNLGNGASPSLSNAASIMRRAWSLALHRVIARGGNGVGIADQPRACALSQREARCDEALTMTAGRIA